MNFIDTAKICMLAYPTIHPTVSAFAQYVFFGYGTQMFWDQGALRTYEEWPTRERAILESREHFRTFGHVARKLPVDIRRQAHDYEFLCNNIDEVVESETWDLDFTGMRTGFNQLGPIWNIPGDIQKDWLLAAYKQAKAFEKSLNNVQYVSEGDAEHWRDMLPGLITSLDNFAVSKGWLATHEQRKKNAAEISKMLGEVLGKFNL